MMFSRSFIATMALQLALSVTLKNETVLCTGFALTTPTTTTTTTTTSALNAHVRRSHTYEQDSQKVFTDIDKDGNGKIDVTELRDYLVQKGPYTDAVAKSIFERLDVNRDGHLVLEELEQGMKEHQFLSTSTSTPKTQFKVQSKPTSGRSKKNNNNNHRRKQNNHHKSSIQQQAKRFFDQLDVNHDGYISLTELKEHFLVQRMSVVAQSMSSLTGKASSNITSTNNTYSEANIQKLFQVLDVNHDGRISLQDLREAFVKYPSVRHAFQK